MRALTLTEPWAMLVATGDKRIETRSFSTSHRGPLAIHAAKTIPAWVREWVRETTAVQTMLLRAGFNPDLSDIPLGAVVATCQIVACISTDSPHFQMPKTKDRILGNFGPGRFAWYLEDIVRVHPPVPVRGQLGLFEIDAEALGIPVLVTGRLF
jgi:hypothetical protein